MYCDIQDKFLGKRLNTMFTTSTRNTVASLISNQHFKDWFGDGKVDSEGNPIINEQLSFTNGKGEKRAIFDFGDVGFKDKADVQKFLKSMPSIYTHNSTLFVNNYKRATTGRFAAEGLMKAVNVINYYYPNLLSVQRYQRSQTSPFTKGDIPLFAVTINDIDYAKQNTLFSVYEGKDADKNSSRFNQLDSVQELFTLQKHIDEFKPYGMVQGDLETVANPSKVTNDVYESLKEFFAKLNPLAKMEEVDNLSTAGAAYIRDFLIQVSGEHKYSALPEEVSHFLVSMLPKDGDMYKSLISNITSFVVYQTTLASYRDREEYRLDNGQIDYNKIKQEAAAKLIAEYVYALSTNDFERANILTKTKDGFISRLWQRLVNWIRTRVFLDRQEKVDIYIEAANKILSQDTDNLSYDNIEKEGNDVFFAASYSDREKIDAMAESLTTAVAKAGNMDDLIKVVDNFRKELGKNVNSILHDKGLQKLNEALSVSEDPDDQIKINRMGELHALVKSINIDDFMAADNGVQNLSKFLHVVNNMEQLAKVYDLVVDTYIANGSHMNIAELMSFANTYRNLQSLITSDFADVLARSRVGIESIAALDKATSLFKSVEDKIIVQLRDEFSINFKGIFSPQNATIRDILGTELANTVKHDMRAYEGIANKEGVTTAKAVTNLIEDLINNKGLLASLKKFTDVLKDIGVNEKLYKSGPVAAIMKNLTSLYTTDRSIENFLSGLGADIDLTSQFSHWIMAGIKNHDLMLANVAKYIVERRTAGENLALVASQELLRILDPIINKLKDMGMNEYDMGKAITYIDYVYDNSEDSDGKPIYKDNKREIVLYLSPYMHQAMLDQKTLDVESTRTFQEYKKDPTTEKKLAHQKARKDVITFRNNYMNNPYTAEYRQHLAKWDANEDYLDIRQEWNNISEEMRAYMDQFDQDKKDKKAMDQWTALQAKRAQLLNKEGKTEEEIKKIDLFSQHYEENKKFREDDHVKTQRNFNLAVRSYTSKIDTAFGIFMNIIGDDPGDLDLLEKTLQDTLKDPTIRIKNDYIFASSLETSTSAKHVTFEQDFDLVRDILAKKFKERNQVKVKTPAFYEHMKLYTDVINELKKQKGLTPQDIKTTELYEKINEIMTGRNDYYGQRNSESFSEREIAQIKKLEDQIRDLKGIFTKTYEVTQEMKDKAAVMKSKFPEMLDKYQEFVDELNKGNLKPEREDYLKKEIAVMNRVLEANHLVSRQKSETSELISKMYKSLRSLQNRVPTQSYWEKMEQLLESFQTMLTDLQNKASDPSTKPNALVLIKNQIVDLNVIITGRAPYIKGKPNYGEMGGLMEAVYNRNHELLDKIINNEYTVEGLGRNARFNLFLDQDDNGDTRLSPMNQSLSKWFHDNHRQDKMWVADENKKNGGSMENRKYVRRLFSSYMDPAEQIGAHGEKLWELKTAKKYVSTKVKDGTSIEDPTTYYKPKVSWKDTNDMEKWTIDNKTAQPYAIPMSREQLRAEGKTSEEAMKYVNKDYYKIYDDQSEKGKLLQQYHSNIMSTYLSEQDNKPDKLKGFFKYAVISLDELHHDIHSIENLPNRFRSGIDAIKHIFTSKDRLDAQDQVAGLSQMRDTDEYTQRIDQKAVPRLGMNTKLEINRVNRNALQSMLAYLKHSKDFDARSDLDPFVSGLLDVMKANEKNGRTNQKKRREIIQKMYDQMITQEMPDNVTNNDFFKKMVHTLMGFAGLRLAGDAVGGVVNFIQANMNNLTEAFAGQHTTMKSYAVGYGKATEMISNMLLDFDKKSDLHYLTLLYDGFDFIQGEWAEDISERASTMAKRFNRQKWLMYPRKNGELHAQSAMALSILDNNTAYNQLDGKSYPIWQIYEKKDGILALKKGFYDIDGTDGSISYPWNPVDGAKFLALRNKIHIINLELHGNYAGVNQTELSRHSLGKLTEMMKRWFVPAMDRRMGRTSYDVTKNSIDEGYYNTGVQAGFKILKSMLTLNTVAASNYAHYFWTTPRKAQNLRRLSFDFFAAGMLFAVTALLGYDGNDPDKNKKLQNSSWLYNEALLVALRSYSEQTSFIPVPPFGFTEMSRNLLDPFSVAKSSFANAAGITSSLYYAMRYALGDKESAGQVLYQHETGQGKGPLMPFFGDLFGTPGNKGDLKMMNYVWRLFGYSSAQMDPAYYIKNFQSMQQKNK